MYGYSFFVERNGGRVYPLASPGDRSKWRLTKLTSEHRTRPWGITLSRPKELKHIHTPVGKANQVIIFDKVFLFIPRVPLLIHPHHERRHTRARNDTNRDRETSEKTELPRKTQLLSSKRVIFTFDTKIEIRTSIDQFRERENRITRDQQFRLGMAINWAHLSHHRTHWLGNQ